MLGTNQLTSGWLAGSGERDKYRPLQTSHGTDGLLFVSRGCASCAWEQHPPYKDTKLVLSCPACADVTSPSHHHTPSRISASVLRIFGLEG